MKPEWEPISRRLLGPPSPERQKEQLLVTRQRPPRSIRRDYNLGDNPRDRRVNKVALQPSTLKTKKSFKPLTKR